MVTSQPVLMRYLSGAYKHLRKDFGGLSVDKPPLFCLKSAIFSFVLEGIEKNGFS
jgi:hypothetical protein